MIVGYKLLDSNNNEIQNWGGIWGQTPSIPNPLFLPNGDVVHAAATDIEYGGYKLVEWIMEEEPIIIPDSVTPRQIRLLLLNQNLLDDVEALLAQRPKTDQITWEFATEFLRTDPLLNQLATDLGLTSEQIDQFFIEAKQL